MLPRTSFVRLALAVPLAFASSVMVSEAGNSDSIVEESGGSGAVGIENNFCRVEFDPENGGLSRITNRLLEDDCLKHGRTGYMPFRVYADLTKEFVIGQNDIFQLVFDDPAVISRTVIQPDTCRLVEVRREDGLALTYEGQGFQARLRVKLAEGSGESDWSLRVTNIGTATRELLVSFPRLEGIRLGSDSKGNLATAMDQAGVVVPAWERHGGVLGESNQFSMQWHAVWDPVSRSALALIFMDAEVRPKRLELARPNLELHYFPPVKLGPNASHDLPPVRMLVYEGDWRPAARAYRSWYQEAYRTVDPPEWFRRSNGSAGRHFKKSGPGVPPNGDVQWVMESFRELPAAHLQTPIDNLEYAFFTRGSMLSPNVHTDGDNVIREDLGGAEAMREGIAGVHRLGLHTTLYIEGFIFPEESDLFRSGKAERWSVVHRDGSRTGPYTKQGFHHMCPGCVEWQDHLASTTARLLRETGADGVRLDSLGFYYLPCYDIGHNHETPFGYNDWIKQLLAKVRKAALEVNPDALLTTEGPSDWFGQWFHGALTARCPRDLPMMRLAVGPFRPYVYASGALWGSLSGFPGGGLMQTEMKTLDANWLCARFPVHDALVWGDVADEDPRSSDPEIVTRRFEGDGYWAVVAARPACQDPLGWPRGTGPAKAHSQYTLTLPGLASDVEDAVLCDIETLTWRPLKIEVDGADVKLRLESNWALLILRRVGGPAVVGFEALPTLPCGSSTTLRAALLSGGAPAGGLHVEAPGLEVTPSDIPFSGETTITVPTDAHPGYYAVSLTGANLLGTKRFLVVE